MVIVSLGWFGFWRFFAKKTSNWHLLLLTKNLWKRKLIKLRSRLDECKHVVLLRNFILCTLPSPPLSFSFYSLVIEVILSKIKNTIIFVSLSFVPFWLQRSLHRVNSSLPVLWERMRRSFFLTEVNMKDGF